MSMAFASIRCSNMEFWMFFVMKEMDCIVNQMMAVAEYLGWDASELKPVISFVSSINSRNYQVIIMIVNRVNISYQSSLPEEFHNSKMIFTISNNSLKLSN